MIIARRSRETFFPLAEVFGPAASFPLFILGGKNFRSMGNFRLFFYPISWQGLKNIMINQLVALIEERGMFVAQGTKKASGQLSFFVRKLCPFEFLSKYFPVRWELPLSEIIPHRPGRVGWKIVFLIYALSRGSPFQDSYFPPLQQRRPSAFSSPIAH